MVVALAALHPSQLQLRASVASGTKRGKQFRFGDVDSVIVTVNVSFEKKTQITKKYAVAGDRTRVVRVTGGNTYHYTTTTLLSSFVL